MDSEHTEELPPHLKATGIPGVSINTESRLYVIRSGDGYTCRGFENLMTEANEMAQLLGESPIPESKIGTVAAYVRHEELVRIYSRSKHSKNTWFSPGTPPRVRQVLEAARKAMSLVRLWLGDETGLVWLEEFDTIGYVGRSCGPIRIPILVPKGECGGGAISTNRILQIRLEDTKDVLYRHPDFRLPEMKVGELGLRVEDYLYGVFTKVDGDWSLHSRHKTYAEACGLIAWFSGEEYAPAGRDLE